MERMSSPHTCAARMPYSVNAASIPLVMVMLSTGPLTRIPAVCTPESAIVFVSVYPFKFIVTSLHTIVMAALYGALGFHEILPASV